MSDSIIYYGHQGIGDRIEAPALVAGDDFSARYDLDLEQGVFSRPTHALFGESYVGKVLVLNRAKGGVATAWMLRAMVATQLAPAALLLNDANPVMIQGAVFAGLTFMDRFEVDVTEVISTNDIVTVDPAAGTISVEFVSLGKTATG